MAKRTSTKKPKARRAAKARTAGRTRSFQCPDELWAAVEQLAQERGLGAPAAAARMLLRRGLELERKVHELDAARAWQIEQAWAEVQLIGGGDRAHGSWEEIDQAADRARRSLRVRAAAPP